MLRTWLSYINFGLVAILLLLVLGIGFLTLKGSSPIIIPEVQPKKTVLPKNAFELPKKAYDSIGEPFLSLEFSPSTLRLPDLRQQLTYYGTNGRPDASLNRLMLYFGIAGGKSNVSVPNEGRLYLLYDKKQTPPRYVFSPSNAETSLWIEATAKEKEAGIKVVMKNEHGDEIHEPEDNAYFMLPEKEQVRVSNMGQWEIGKFRVDGTLLARQHARWYGKDIFMEKHGGEEYSHHVGKERIDFEDEESPYSVYLQQGDNLVWLDNHWESAVLGEKTLGRPLMQVKKVDDRLMTLELWDPEGKNKIALNLLKSNEAWMPQAIVQSFKFVGARTRSQSVVEINDDRIVLRAQDWLLLTDKGWKKLITPEEIDEYVNRKITGPLFVFHGIIKKDDRQVLSGALYNASRTDVYDVELNPSNVPVPDEKQIKVPEKELE